MTTEEDKSFTDRVEEIREERASENRGGGKSLSEGVEEVPTTVLVWALVVSSGILALVTLEGSILLSIFFASIAIIILISFYSDESLQEAIEDIEQQQSSSKTNQRRICSNCGWQNPKENNYCHNCGEELNP